MDSYEETFATWNKVASLYQEKFMNLDIYNETYLSLADTETFISNAKKRLNKNGIFYLSYVDGDNSNSGFITGKNGDRVFFYCHDTKDMIQFLKLNDFEAKKQFQIPYLKTDASNEIHAILISIRK